MALDTIADPILQVFLELGRDAVNDDLSATLGEDPIKAIYQHPNALQHAPAMELPALSMHRAGPSRLLRWSNFYQDDELVTLTVEYVAPAHHAERVDELWPLLHRVWKDPGVKPRRGLIDVWCRGYDSAHASGAKVLAAAGVMEIRTPTIVKQERYGLTDAGQAYPSFIATFQIHYRPTVDTEAQDFLGMDVGYDLQDPAGELEDHVEDEVNL